MVSRTESARGFTIIELLVAISIIAVLFGMLIPAIGSARDSAQVNASKSNLRQISVAHKLYGADWADRHVTYVRDNLGLFHGDVAAYSEAIYGEASGSLAHPPVVAGWGYTAAGTYELWRFDVDFENTEFFQPINFPGPPNDDSWADGFGWFTFGHQARPMSDYLNGRWHDPIFHPPKDRVDLPRIEPCFDIPGEFVGSLDSGGTGPAACDPALSGYSLSPAGLFSPETFAENEGSFWRAPWETPSGYRVPSFGEVRYPTLKTHMLERHWLQNSEQACNSAFVGCEPYYFNHSFQSVPVTLFYDGSVRMMSVYEAMSSDRRSQRQTGHGLWSRDTPFGEDGYFIQDGYDFAETSYHILTIDGARGRDTIGQE